MLFHSEIENQHPFVTSDTVYWAELRFEEDGRYAVCSKRVGHDTDFTTWTPREFNARTRVHEYGGGAHFVHDGTLYFSNMADQRMYRQAAPEAAPTPITPEGKGWRYADGDFHSLVSLSVFFLLFKIFILVTISTINCFWSPM